METIPKVFISYNWTSEAHSKLILDYATRLVHDRVDVVLDQWALQKGQDKYAFMEKMVTDPSVTHVLLFSDAEYARKADSREAGVGAESQIISKRLYEEAGQTRVIAIVCEKNGAEPCLPTFIKSRIYTDFTSPERVNENWEGLIRHLNGKPSLIKPSLGPRPSFLDNDLAPTATSAKWQSLKDALLAGKSSVGYYRKDFVDLVIDEIRASQPIDCSFSSPLELEKRLAGDLQRLLLIRDNVVSWISLEVTLKANDGEISSLMEFLERLLEVKCRPIHVKSWNDWWFETSAVVVYEIFLYTVAILIKANKPLALAHIVYHRFLRPEAHVGNNPFSTIADFDARTDLLNSIAIKKRPNRLSNFADIIHERATLSEIPFRDLMQADLLLYFTELLNDRGWFPRTLAFSEYGLRFPSFCARRAGYRF